MSVDFKMPQTWQPETAPPETAPQEPAPQETPDPPAAPPAGAVSAGVAAPAAVPAAATSAAAAAWSLPARIAFRFAFCYLLLYNFPFPLTWLPFNGLDGLFLGYFKLWDFIVLWTGKHVLHLGHEVALLRGKTGSGDTTYNYIQILCYAALAVVAALVWTLAARRAREHQRLHEGMRIYVRYALGSILLGYGMAKVIKTQFPFPSHDRLMQPFGEASPMGLLWTFMGVSTPYTVFAGAMEVLGGMLLFFRRTTTLGALVVVAVMTNVVMLNLCYDVPVKQYSLHLLLMAAFLLVPDLRRLANVLVLNRPAAPVNLTPPWTARWARVSALALSILFLGYLLFITGQQNLAYSSQFGPGANQPPIHGTFEVEEFIRNGRTEPPLLTDASRWRRLTVSYREVLGVRWMDGSLHRFRTQYTPKQSLALSAWESHKQGEPEKQGAFTYALPDKDHLVLQGTLLADALTVKLRRVDASKLLLVSRGFHWVSEFPYNR
ncbi:MAG TPA: hypothetical protein VHG32_03700 [Thermoanaerobaculia bacterium]|nr:hypothetical protein [Thermoanaerobaculia bacterium]